MVNSDGLIHFECFKNGKQCSPAGSDGKESACNEIPGLGRSPGEGNGYPFQYSCLENSMGRGDWRAAVHGVTESEMTERLSLSLFSPKKCKMLELGKLGNL